jgi:hypothetical protein
MSCFTSSSFLGIGLETNPMNGTMIIPKKGLGKIRVVISSRSPFRSFVSLIGQSLFVAERTIMDIYEIIIMVGVVVPTFLVATAIHILLCLEEE